MAIQYMAS